MSKGRLEAFSDGVMAIIITIMVLELKVPHEATWAALLDLVPTFLSYLLSFIFVGIYWNNHHHMFQVVKHVNGRVLWANIHLLFWLSLVPFATAWMGENHFATLTLALYGVVLWFAGLAYYVLAQRLLAIHGKESLLATAIQRDTKAKVSLMLYTLAVPLAFVSPWIAGGLFVAVALLWLIPDTRIEKALPQP